MFWNSKAKKDAHVLASFLLRLREMSIGQNYEQFLEFCRRQDFQVEEQRPDPSDSLSGDRRFSFTDGLRPWDEAEFVHHVTSSKGVSGEHELSFSALGYGRFFGFSVYWSGLPFRAEVRAFDKAQIGRDAPKLLAELLRIPGFKRLPAPGDWRGWLED